MGRFRTLEHEYDGVKSHMDDEIQQKDEVGRTLNKTLGEVNHWRAKYEQDAVAKIEELEYTKVKLQARLAESEGTMTNLVSTSLTRAGCKKQQKIVPDQFGPIQNLQRALIPLTIGGLAQTSN